MHLKGRTSKKLFDLFRHFPYNKVSDQINLPNTAVAVQQADKFRNMGNAKDF